MGSSRAQLVKPMCRVWPLPSPGRHVSFSRNLCVTPIRG